MLVYQNPLDRPKTPSVVAIGSFDGLHLGHQQLLASLKRRSRELHVPSIVYTFDLPTRVLLTGTPYLYTLAEKLHILESLGIDEVIAVPFTPEFSRRTTADFLHDLAILLPQAIVVGNDFRFGHGRSGGVAELHTITPEVIALALERQAEQEIHASHIRHALEHGQLATANAMLGRAYSAQGVVVAGAQLGRSIAFPTANVAVSDGKLLPKGVFVARLWLEDEHHSHNQSPRQRGIQGMANVGTRPTVDGVSEKLEVHLFNFDEDIYGAEVRVEFLHYLRGEQKFSGLDGLIEQLRRDQAAARAYFSP
jgi:riboflavin kinase / FMN adenylyltransferase